MGEKLPEPYGWLYYGSPDGPLFRRDHPEGLYWLCVSSAPVYSHEQMRVAVAEAADLRRERDEAREQAAFVEQHLGVISGVLDSAEPLQIDDIAARLHLLIIERDELAARLAEIDRAEPVILRANNLDAALYALPSPAAAPERAEPAAAKRAARAAVEAIYFDDSSDYLSALWEVVRALRPDLVDLLACDGSAAFAAVQDAPEDDEPPVAAPERAGPAANELPTRCTECGQLGWHKFGCGHVAHERGPRVTAQSSGSTSCPRGEQR